MPTTSTSKGRKPDLVGRFGAVACAGRDRWKCVLKPVAGPAELSSSSQFLEALQSGAFGHVASRRTRRACSRRSPGCKGLWEYSRRAEQGRGSCPLSIARHAAVQGWPATRHTGALCDEPFRAWTRRRENRRKPKRWPSGVPDSADFGALLVASGSMLAGPRPTT